MSVPTVSWSESTPAGSDNINAGDNRIRELKTQIREVIDVDHDFPSSGQAADVGQHKQVTLQEQADLGTGAVNATILGSQTVSGKGELVYTDEDDNDIQITSNGSIHAPSISGVYPAANVAAIVNIMNLVYPVGSVVTLGVSTNPGTLFGVGTWTAIEGRVIVGIAGSGTFNTLDGTGGAETHTLVDTELPTNVILTNTGTNYGDGTSAAIKNNSATGGNAHNNLQPYIVKYVWQRTA